MAKYMHNQFDFYGIKTPERRSIYKDIIREAKKAESIDWQLLNECWNNDYREFQYFVCDYLKALQKFLVLMISIKLDLLLKLNSGGTR